MPEMASIVMPTSIVTAYIRYGHGTGSSPWWNDQLTQ